MDRSLLANIALYLSGFALAILIVTYGTMGMAIALGYFEAWFNMARSLVGMAVGYWLRISALVAVFFMLAALVLEYLSRAKTGKKTYAYLLVLVGFSSLLLLVVCHWY